MALIVASASSQYATSDVDTEDFFPGPISFHGWFKPTSNGATQTFFCHGRSDSTTFIALFQLLDSGAARIWCGGNTAGHRLDSTELVDFDAWNAIGGTWNGTACDVWVNGVKASFTSSSAYAATTVADFRVTLGATRTTSVSSYFNGKISQAAIWNQANADADYNTLLTTAPGDAGIANIGSRWVLAADGNDAEATNVTNLSGVNSPTFSTADEPPLGGVVIVPRFFFMGMAI